MKTSFYLVKAHYQRRDVVRPPTERGCASGGGSRGTLLGHAVTVRPSLSLVNLIIYKHLAVLSFHDGMAGVSFTKENTM